MKKQLKAIPKFASEAQERAFWEAHDSTDHLDWSKANKVPNPEFPIAINALNAAPRTQPSNYPGLVTDQGAIAPAPAP